MKTPTSATGPETGFTLVELLVVVAIIGLAAAAVALTIPGDQGQLRGEAEALAARLVAARDMAIITNRDVRATIAPSGYRFDVAGAGGWHVPDSKALAQRALPEGVGAVVDLGPAAALDFDATGLATPARIALRRGDNQTVVTVDAAGDVHVEG